jgi:hypothetical protein
MEAEHQGVVKDWRKRYVPVPSPPATTSSPCTAAAAGLTYAAGCGTASHACALAFVAAGSLPMPARRLSIGFVQPDAAAAAALGLDLREAGLGFRTTAADIVLQSSGSAAAPEPELEPDPAPAAAKAAKSSKAKGPMLSKGCRVRFRVALDDSKESAHAGRRLRAVGVVPLAETSTFCECCQIECGNANRLAQHTAGRRHQEAILQAGGTAAELEAAVEAARANATDIAKGKRESDQLNASSGGGGGGGGGGIPTASHRAALVRAH